MTMLPAMFASIIFAATRLATCAAARALTLITWSKALALMAAAGSRREIPAQLTRPCRGGKSCRVLSRAMLSAISTHKVRHPNAANAWASRPRAKTSAPLAISCWAISRPMPLLAPVTRMRWYEKSKVVDINKDLKTNEDPLWELACLR